MSSWSARCARSCLVLVTTLLWGCLGGADRQTLASLRDTEPDLVDVQVTDGLDSAMIAYQRFLEDAPKSSLTPEAMRRLADLKLEKEYGIFAAEPAAGLPPVQPVASPATAAPDRPTVAGIAEVSESERDFERRATGGERIALSAASEDEELELPAGGKVEWAGPLEAIELYDQILATYPNYEHNDRVLYQKARAYDELGRNDEAIAVIALLVARYPYSKFLDEVEFRRGEYFFTRKKYLDAEEAYSAVTAMGVASQYYELALYKLGWTLYKQELHEEALQQYIALLDYKVSTGYDFDQPHNEADERRVADTYRVISLSFSSLGGPEAVQEYFAVNGNRGYENRIYSHFGEFYFEKLRYNDAATVYKTFVNLYPLNRSSPHFGMRVAEIYEAGGFPKLVLESKKEFAASYGLQSKYWHHFDVDASPDVLSYLKSNLRDLANHYHALYQDPERAEEKTPNFAEALRWYRAYLASFPNDLETPAIHYQLADLLLEHEDFSEAAQAYEHVAYEYPSHEQSGAAGYAAIYAHRQHQKSVVPADQQVAREAAVSSTLRFVDTFAAHEHAPVVLGAAVDDLYDMKDYARAIETGQRVIAQYSEADPLILRSAWLVVGHASFDTESYPQAEHAYARVLEMTNPEDESHQGVVDNLAAAIYKQGEAASVAQDHRSAADHFLRIARAAPTSEIRAAAEYDAGAALVLLEDWTGAAVVFESFRTDHPEHELHDEATKQMAFVYRKDGDLERAAEEYERVAAEASEPDLRREALLLAGELYEESELPDRALEVYLSYVAAFPRPLETAVETRSKIAGMYAARDDHDARRVELRRIIAIDQGAGDERTDRVRYLAAQAALVLSEDLYRSFDEVALVQPFEQNLQKKQRRMATVLEALGNLVDYEVGEVTAAATFYVAEVYFGFSQALISSERPANLSSPELLDYELMLEEEAFPFEEKAIAVHEKNLELMTAGVYGSFIEKSLEKLAVLMPGRYAKFEMSSGLIDSIDSYAYHAPTTRPTDLPDNDTGAQIPEAPEGSEASPDPSPAAESAAASQRTAERAAG
jgi:tetratricopeptide (TPR) repeat protein